MSGQSYLPCAGWKRHHQACFAPCLSAVYSSESTLANDDHSAGVGAPQMWNVMCEVKNRRGCNIWQKGSSVCAADNNARLMDRREDSRRVIQDCWANEVRVGKGRSYWWLIPRFGPGDDVPGLGVLVLEKVRWKERSQVFRMRTSKNVVCGRLREKDEDGREQYQVTRSMHECELEGAGCRCSPWTPVKSRWIQQSRGQTAAPS